MGLNPTENKRQVVVNMELSNLSRDEKIVGGILLALLVPGMVVGLTQMTGLNTFSLWGSTLCVNGVSDVNIDNSAAGFEDNQAWKISTSTGCNDLIMGGGGEVDKEELRDGDIEAMSGFKAGMTDFKAYFYNEIDYSEQKSDGVYKIQVKAFKCDSGLLLGCNDQDRSNVENWQSNSDNQYYDYTKEWRSSTRHNWIYASRAVKVGQVHDFSADQGSTFEAELTLCADGTCESEKISKDEPSIMLGSGEHQARVTHTGSLIGELRGINYDEVTPVEDNNGNIVLASQELLTEYDNEVSGVEQCMAQRSGWSFDNILPDHEGVENECSVGNTATNAVTDQRQLIEDSLSIEGDVRVTDGQVRTVTEDPNVVERVGLDWTIDTAWVGVFENVPEPQIVSTQDFELEENDRRTIELPVKNNGKGGYIQANAECDYPISGGSDRQWVADGGTQRFNLDISSGTGSGGEYTCTVNVQASDQPRETSGDSADFTVTLVEQYTGTPTNPGDDDDETGGIVRPPEDPQSAPWAIIALFTAVILGIVGYYNRRKIREVLNQ